MYVIRFSYDIVYDPYTDVPQVEIPTEAKSQLPDRLIQGNYPICILKYS